jgi:MFS family permease
MVSLGAAMATVLYEPAFVIVAKWFGSQRSKALTILTFIGGLASVIYIPLVSVLVIHYGWRIGLQLLAAFIAVLTLPIHLVALRPTLQAGTMLEAAPEDPSGVRFQDAVRGSPFWLMTIAFSLATITTVGVNIHLFSYLVESGKSAAFAAGVASLVGITGLPGRVTLTPLGEFVSRKWIVATIFLLQAAGIALLMSSSSNAVVVSFAVLFGIGFGAITPARAALLSELYGSLEYGRIGGLQGFFVTSFRAAAPVVAGALYIFGQGYRPVWWCMIALSLLAASAVSLLKITSKDEVKQLSPATQGTPVITSIKMSDPDIAAGAQT